jgi:hypothetical protein
MGLLTQQAITVPVTFGPPQAQGIGESDGLPCKGYVDNSAFFSLCFPHQHYWWVSYPPYPSLVVSSFHHPIGWPSILSIVDCVHITFE